MVYPAQYYQTALHLGTFEALLHGLPYSTLRNPLPRKSCLGPLHPQLFLLPQLLASRSTVWLPVPGNQP